MESCISSLVLYSLKIPLFDTARTSGSDHFPPVDQGGTEGKGNRSPDVVDGFGIGRNHR